MHDGTAAGAAAAAAAAAATDRLLAGTASGLVLAQCLNDSLRTSSPAHALRLGDSCSSPPPRSSNNKNEGAAAAAAVVLRPVASPRKHPVLVQQQQHRSLRSGSESSPDGSPTRSSPHARSPDASTRRDAAPSRQRQQQQDGRQLAPAALLRAARCQEPLQAGDEPARGCAQSLRGSLSGGLWQQQEVAAHGLEVQEQHHQHKAQQHLQAPHPQAEQQRQQFRSTRAVGGAAALTTAHSSPVDGKGEQPAHASSSSSQHSTHARQQLFWGDQQQQQQPGSPLSTQQARWQVASPGPLAEASLSHLAAPSGGARAPPAAADAVAAAVAGKQLMSSTQQQQEQLTQVLSSSAPTLLLEQQDASSSLQEQQEPKAAAQENEQPPPQLPCSHQPCQALVQPPEAPADKQQQMLVRMCAKHGLPLPHPRSMAGHKQQPPQQQRGAVASRQAPQRLTQQGGEMAKQRQLLLQQLRRSSITRRLPGRHVPAAAAEELGRQQAGQQAAADEAGDSADTRQQPQAGVQQEQELLPPVAAAAGAVGPGLPAAPVSEWHLVDGLQYVHALLASIKLPSAVVDAGDVVGDGSGSSGGAAAGGSGLACEQLQQQAVPCSVLRHPPREQQQQPGQTAELSSHSTQPAPAWLRDNSQLQAACNAALTKLRQATVGIEGAASAAQDHCQPGGPARAAGMPLQDALLLLCLVDAQADHQQQQQASVALAGQFRAVHALVQEHMRPAGMAGARQQQEQRWQQQVRRLQDSALCPGPRVLCLRAVQAVCYSRSVWLAEQLQPLRACLQQVQQQLWRHQALAARGSPGSPTKAAAASPRRCRPRSPDRSLRRPAAAGGGARGSRVQQLALRTTAAAGAAGSAGPQQLPATVVAKRLAVAAVLKGSVDYAAVCAGWEGSSVLIRMLTDLRNKLACKLTLHALLNAARVAGERSALLAGQLPHALRATQLSAAFSAWRAWAAPRGSIRGARQDLRARLRGQQLRRVLTAWQQAGKESSWLRARLHAMQQRRSRALLLTALRAWVLHRTECQLGAATNTLAVLWHARVTSTHVLIAWASATGSAADEDDDGSSGSEDSSSSSSAIVSGSSSFAGCSSTPAAAMQRQHAWRAFALAAVRESEQRCCLAHAAAAGAAAELHQQQPPLAASAALLQQTWQLQRQHHINLLALSSDGNCPTGQQEQCKAPGLSAERSLSLLASDSSSCCFAGPLSGCSRYTPTCDDDGGSGGEADLCDEPPSEAVSSHAPEAGVCSAVSTGAGEVAAGKQQGSALSSSTAGAACRPAASGQQQQHDSLPQAKGPAEAVVQQQEQEPAEAVLQLQQEHADATTEQDAWPAGSSILEVLLSLLQQTEALAAPAANGGSLPAAEGATAMAATLEQLSAEAEALACSPDVLAAVLELARSVAALAEDRALAAAAAPLAAETVGAGVLADGMAAASSCLPDDAGTPPLAAAAAAATCSAAGANAGAHQQEPGSPSATGADVAAALAETIAAIEAAAAAAECDGVMAVEGRMAPDAAAEAQCAPAASTSVQPRHQLQRQLHDDRASQPAVAVEAAPAAQVPSLGPTAATTAVLSAAGGPVALPVADAAVDMHAADADGCSSESSSGIAGPWAAAAAAAPAIPQLETALAALPGSDASTVFEAESCCARDLATAVERLRSAATTSQATGAATCAATAGWPAASAAGGSAAAARAGVTAGSPSGGAASSSLRQLAGAGQQCAQRHRQPPGQAAAAAGQGSTTTACRTRDKAQLKAAAAAHYRRLLLRRSLQQWLWLLDGQQLLTRVFAAADAAWSAREQQLVAGGDAGDRGAPFARDFQLLRKAFSVWRRFAAAQLMSTAALAAHEAAAAYHTSRLKVRAWSAWCQAVQEGPAAQARHGAALSSCAFQGWRQLVLVRRQQQPHCRSRVRQHLLAGTGWCHSEQQWRATAVQRRALQSWAEAAHSGEKHYRHRLTASAFSGWQLAAESTSTALAAFQDRWQRQRLLQRTLLLWRGLVLLLRHQRQEAAGVDAWRAQRLVHGVLLVWRDVAAALAVQRAASDAAVQHYERSLRRRKLLQWSLVACASSAARLYYAQVLCQRCMRAWRREAAAAAAAELQQELQQQQQAAPTGSSAWAAGSAADTALAADVAAAAWAGYAAGAAPWQLEQQQQDEVFVSMQEQAGQLAVAQGVAGLALQPGWLLLPAAAGAPRGAADERSHWEQARVTEAARGSRGKAGQRPTAAAHSGGAQTAAKKRGVVVRHTATAALRR